MGEKRLSFFFSVHGKEAKSSLDSQALFACCCRANQEVLAAKLSIVFGGQMAGPPSAKLFEKLLKLHTERPKNVPGKN